MQVVARMHYPRARFRPDDYGSVATVRTVPGVSRKECEQAASHLANYWRCVRVQVSQPAPGGLLIRGLRSDPLTLPLPMGEAPEGVYEATSVQHPLRVYLGRDEWGTHRWVGLAGLTGITVAGLPGAGKTRDAAVAALGETIRDYPTYCPTSLQGSDYIGVATVSLRTGHDPFVRIRCPHVTEADACNYAERAASCRLDPTVSTSGREVVSLRQAIAELQPHLRVVVPPEAGGGR